LWPEQKERGGDHNCEEEAFSRPFRRNGKKSRHPLVRETKATDVPIIIGHSPFIQMKGDVPSV